MHGGMQATALMFVVYTAVHLSESDVCCFVLLQTCRLTPAIDILRSGGLGIIPTDTSYVFACDLHSRRGVDRIFELKKVCASTCAALL
jgi:tRNA A37 threonylcarbamoyladenosine synthetase subunit TsaC/SUA5/YrdC